MSNVDLKLAEEFAKEIVLELKKEDKLELNLMSWGLLEATLILKIQGMNLVDALDKNKLTVLVYETINTIIDVDRGDTIDQKIIDLLNKDLVELIVTKTGKLSYRWKY